MSTAPNLLQHPTDTTPSGLTFYPCQCNKQLHDPIVLVHGWGADSQIWRDFPNQLSQYADIYTLDLPGFGASALIESYSEGSVIDWLDEQLPDTCYLIGLSLGGMLCRAYAAQNPTRVRGLITISTNLRFVADKQYPQGMSKADFSYFSQSWRQDPNACLKRFKSLQAQGDQHQRQLMAELRNLNVDIDTTGASGLLDLLANLDGAGHIEHIDCPSLAIFGAEDRLVPASVAKVLPKNHSRVVIPNAAHLPHLSEPSRVLSEIKEFFLCENNLLDKVQLAKSFGSAARTYEAAASVQNWSGQQLIKGLENVPCVNSILDLGCGTGTHCAQFKEIYPQASVLGIDLAAGMLNYARYRYKGKALNWICCDAERLPIVDYSQSIVFSNFALQWCENLQQTLSEIFRVLQLGGHFYFAVPGPRTLNELRAAWSEVDSTPRINEFLPLDHWQDSLRSCGFTAINIQRNKRIEYFSTVKDLMHSIKAVGANVKKSRDQIFTGKKQFEQLYNAYEKYRTSQGEIPATWDIIYGVAVK